MEYTIFFQDLSYK